ncbi:transposase domain-containing protein [Paraglaciecola sp. 2405UD69-4]|uniref:transposase domain-containing protein n=1 Tax=Paraglaciecola sp. 2405UD69-4 TaxID=3391836 RepID=UPI0039C946AA
MSLVSVLESTLAESSELTSLDKLQGLLHPELLEQDFEHAGVATVRRRRLPLDAVIWSVIGMSLFRHESVWDIASKLDISLPGKHKLVAPSALVQARQRLGFEAVQKTFELQASRAFGSYTFEQWNGLNLLAVDGVVYRTEDTPENFTAFGCDRNNHSLSP